MLEMKIRIMKEGIFATLLSAVFFFCVMYPNIPLALEQADRMSIGFDALSNYTSPELSRFVDAVNESGYSPEWYILENIGYASDFDVWWNLDYWETPQQVIIMGRTDCEGKAILTKAVYNELGRRKKASEKANEVNLETEIVSQQQHTFVAVRESRNISGRIINSTRDIYRIEDERDKEGRGDDMNESSDGGILDYDVEINIYSVRKGFFQFIRQVPSSRLLLLLFGNFLIWRRYLCRVKFHCRELARRRDRKKVKKKVFLERKINKSPHGKLTR